MIFFNLLKLLENTTSISGTSCEKRDFSPSYGKVFSSIDSQLSGSIFPVMYISSNDTGSCFTQGACNTASVGSTSGDTRFNSASANSLRVGGDELRTLFAHESSFCCLFNRLCACKISAGL